MNRLVRFLCPVCGKRWKAEPQFLGRRTLCRGCGTKVRVNDNRSAILQGLAVARVVPDPLPPSLAIPLARPIRLRDRVRLWRWGKVFRLGLATVLAGLVLLAALTWIREQNSRAQEEARARQEAAAAARKVQDLLPAAETALENGDLPGAVKLLEQYLTSPLAKCPEQAARLLDEIRQAGSDAEALAFLEKLPEESFTAFTAGRPLPEAPRLQHPALAALYLATLRRNLPRAEELREQERQARAAAVRRAREQRIARLRGTPAFREVLEFTARIRRRDRENRRGLEDFDKRLLEASAPLLGNTGAGAKAEARREADRIRQEQEQELRRIRDWKDRTEEQIAHLRANVKERVRTYKDLTAEDWPLFDALVDAELDRLGKDLEKSGGEEEGDKL